MTDRDRIGRKAEDLACDLLTREGYEILARRYRTRPGEIDVVGRSAGVLCFVEVRSRTRSAWSPEETISWQKNHRIEAAARQYIAEHSLFDEPARFDVVAVDWSGKAARVRLHRDAFEPTGD